MGLRKSAPRTAEEQYLCGVAALNRRDLDAAIAHLGKADMLAPKREHVHYALAAVYSLQGKNDLALKYLASAIKMRPANRTQARHDEDFKNLIAEPPFQELLQH